ncbi:MAG: nucleoside monophosphate kinase [Candidatus Curtissbacteria bacterium]
MNNSQGEVFLLNIYGPPGVGKSTQARLLSQNYGYKEISTGAIILNCIPGFEVNNEEGARHRVLYADMLKSHLDIPANAGYIPDGVMIPILVNEIQFLLNNGEDKIVLGGSIKSFEQARAIQKYIESVQGYFNIAYRTVNLTAQDNELIRRLRGRAVNELRPDNDKPERVVSSFREREWELLRYFGATGNLFNIDSGENFSAEMVHLAIAEFINLTEEGRRGRTETPNAARERFF